MINRIIVLGDSNTYGHGCSDRVYYYNPETQKFVEKFFIAPDDPPSKHCWASLLQKEFPNIEVYNLSSPGRSNTGIFKDLCDFYVNHAPSHSDLIICNAAPDNRIEISKYSSEMETHSLCHNSLMYNWSEDDIQRLAKKQYFAHLHNLKLGVINTTAAVLGCYGWAISNNIQFAFSLTEKYYYTNPLFNSIHQHQIPHIHEYDFSQVGDQEKNKEFISEDQYHPNNAGHQVYYEHEILPLINKLL